MQPMAERLMGSNYDQLHHFIAGRIWDAAPHLAVHSLAVCREYQLTNVCHHGHDRHSEGAHHEQRSYDK
jgi:hypothetical protein